MNIMLDTHVVLWYSKGGSKLASALIPVLNDPAHNFFVSEASILEIEIKHAKNPAAMECSGEIFISLCERANFTLRPITREAILTYSTLNFDAAGDLHKDPFDRLLIAHAKSEGLQLATQDRLLALYGEPCISVYV